MRLQFHSCGFYSCSDIEKIKSTGATYMAASGNDLTFLINYMLEIEFKK